MVETANQNSISEIVSIHRYRGPRDGRRFKQSDNVEIVDRRPL